MRAEIQGLLAISRDRAALRAAECQAEADRVQNAISPLARKVLENEFIRRQQRAAQPCIDLRGKRYGRLIVISLDQRHPVGRNRRYLCRCNCGEVKSVTASNLTNGSTRSCGCLAIEVAKKKCPKASMAWRAMSAATKTEALHEIARKARAG